MSRHNHYVPKQILKKFSYKVGESNRINLINFSTKSIGWRNIDSAFEKRKLYTNYLEDNLNKELENKIKLLFSKICSSQQTVQLNSEEMELLKKYLICQRIRTIAGSNTLIKECKSPYKILDKVCSDDIDKYEYWESALLEILTEPWANLTSSKNVIVREFSKTEDTLYRFVLRPDEQIMINDHGFVEEFIPNLSERQQSLIRDYIRNEFKILEYRDLSMYGNTTLQIFPLSYDCAVVDMPRVWSRFFNTNKRNELELLGLKSPLLTTILDGNPKSKFPFDYYSKNNKMLLLSGGQKSAEMINCITLIQASILVGLKDPISLKPFFEEYSKHGIGNRCEWFLEQYDWSKPI